MKSRYTIIHYEETGSTNEDAKRLAEEGALHGTVVTADKQNMGRGRRGRNWSSPAGKNLYFSVLLRPGFKPDRAAPLTLVMALSAAQAIEELCQIRAEIKWPNDIVVNGKKVCGILTEMSVTADKIMYVVIGTGINVNIRIFPEEIKATASSLLLECGREFERTQLLEKILQRFENNYQIFMQSLDLSGILEDYNGHLVNRNREVRILDPEGEFEGIAEGINSLGELLILRKDGTVTAVYAGEVSVRGLYGYV